MKTFNDIRRYTNTPATMIARMDSNGFRAVMAQIKDAEVAAHREARKAKLEAFRAAKAAR
jgi:hypothetical protein